MDEHTKASLVAAAIRGDSDATRDLWETERRWVAAILLAHKPRDAELDDLLQDVAISFVRTVTSLRDVGAFRPWLRTIAINTARATGRKTTRRRRDASGPPAPEPAAPPASPADARDEGRALLDLALKLPEGYREPLLLRSIQGMSYRQIASLMSVPETTVETRIARARRMLRELAEGREIVPEFVKGTATPGIHV